MILQNKHSKIIYSYNKIGDLHILSRDNNKIKIYDSLDEILKNNIRIKLVSKLRKV